MNLLLQFFWLRSVHIKWATFMVYPLPSLSLLHFALPFAPFNPLHSSPPTTIKFPNEDLQRKPSIFPFRMPIYLMKILFERLELIKHAAKSNTEGFFRIICAIWKMTRRHKVFCFNSSIYRVSRALPQRRSGIFVHFWVAWPVSSWANNAFECARPHRILTANFSMSWAIHKY